MDAHISYMLKMKNSNDAPAAGNAKKKSLSEA
jgi:hypothetical protein